MSQSDDVCIRLIEAKDHDCVLDFLRKHYYPEEPLTAGSEPKQQDEADEKFNMSNIRHNTCLMACKRTETSTECVVGAVMAGPKNMHEAEHLFEEAARLGPTKWGHILQFIACIERDADVYKKYNVTEALHGHVLAVDGCMRGHAIGARLMKELMSLGKQRGFPLLTADCTSLYSAKLCERIGMECVHTVSYASYLNEKGEQVFKPQAPHEYVKTYAIRL